MSFDPQPDEWIRSHLFNIPDETSRFLGPITGLQLLDVGCGDMLADFGLLRLGPAKVTGLDLHAHPYDVVAKAADRIVKAGLELPDCHQLKLVYKAYDGENLPFQDDSFDVVFSWSAFEHVPNVPQVLKEIRRVTKSDGRVFIQVYPWFPSFEGSHLTDYISEPFFHLCRRPEWIRKRLEDYAQGNPQMASWVLGHKWSEFETQNHYSAAMFISEVLKQGFCIERLETILRSAHIEEAPPHVPIADLISAGSMALLRPAK